MNSFSVNIYYPTMEYFVPFLGFYAMSSILFSMAILFHNFYVGGSRSIDNSLVILLMTLLNPAGTICIIVLSRYYLLNYGWYAYTAAPLITFYAYAWVVS